MGSRLSAGGIRPQSIGSQRVDRDQDDIWPCLARRFPRSRLLGYKRQASEKYPGYAQANTRSGFSPPIYPSILQVLRRNLGVRKLNVDESGDRGGRASHPPAGSSPGLLP
jgi:hypothetical protein